ncbi:MAG TPA: glutamate--tRNA ligase [Urbifossiella sp.]|nr:glutamate--tRNA ligase [Urbifossiella sp.]
MTVRTRFAPSPTGYLHIGGVRTALFNYLFAKKHGGQFILRIDDTDQQRNVKEALQPILDGFRWLGLNWDEGAEIGGPHGPYYQSQKLGRYQEAVQQLLARGLAYWDYAKPEETKAEMELAEKEKRPKIYSRRWMAESDADRKRFEADGRTGAVKLKMPREGACRFFDHIRGDMVVEWATEQDTVIQRSDGTVTYNLANVVDDFDMKISHVIRAEEHLSNTPRQLFALKGLGYPRPEYAHVPFVAEPGSKNKLSKRKIAQYLKNPDFKKVYEHARGNVDAWVSSLETISLRLDYAQAFAREFNQTAPTPTWDELVADVKRAIDYSLTYLPTLDLPVSLQNQEDAATLACFNIESELANIPGFTSQLGRTLILTRYLRDLKPEEFNPVLIHYYKMVGYLPAAVLNYLVLLGWSFDDSREDFTLPQMTQLFSLERVNKSPASLDVKKLFAFQERYMAALPLLEKVDGVNPFLKRSGIDADRGVVSRIVEAAGPRIKVFGDILDYADFFIPDEQLPYEPKAVEKHLKKEPGSGWIGELRQIVAAAEPFDVPTLKMKIEAFIQEKQAKPIPVTQTLRVAVTGKEVGFGIYETLAILGKERCLARIDRV